MASLTPHHLPGLKRLCVVESSCHTLCGWMYCGFEEKNLDLPVLPVWNQVLCLYSSKDSRTVSFSPPRKQLNFSPYPYPVFLFFVLSVYSVFVAIWGSAHLSIHGSTGSLSKDCSYLQVCAKHEWDPEDEETKDGCEGKAQIGGRGRRSGSESGKRVSPVQPGPWEGFWPMSLLMPFLCP